MTLHKAVDPSTGQWYPVNDEAANWLAAQGWSIYAMDDQSQAAVGAASGLGYDPNANAQHQITGDKVLTYNAQTQRYEWASRAAVDAQNAATNAYGAQTQRAATMADIIAASRGPENAFQYSNALHGAPDASGVGIFDALAGRLGGSTSAGTPQAKDLHPIDIMGRVQALLNRSFGTGGSNGSGSSSWADQAGMAPTQKEQQAQAATQDAAQTQQGGGQAATTADQTYSPAAHMTAYGPSQAVYGADGKVDTGAYGRASGLSGHGSSDIAWKNKSHQIIEGMGYGHGSDARNAAHAAAGMTGEEFDRIVKHGGNPYSAPHTGSNQGTSNSQARNQNAGSRRAGDTDTHVKWSGAHGDTATTKGTHISNAYATGGIDVVTHPTTIHAGEGGKDELHIIIPLERADQPVPQAILHLANMLSPDTDHMRGIGGVTAGGPTLDAAKRPDGSYGMAAGGGLAVIGGSTTVKQADGKVNAAGQVKVPYNGKTRTVPVSKTTPLPNFGALPPALLSLISPSDWKLIGSQYGAAGGNAEDIPFLLQRGTQGLGRAPGAFGGRVY